MTAHTGVQAPRPLARIIGAEPNKGHFQDALLSLGTAHTHFGHVEVCLTYSVQSTSVVCGHQSVLMSWQQLQMHWCQDTLKPYRHLCALQTCIVLRLADLFDQALVLWTSTSLYYTQVCTAVRLMD